MTRHRLLVGSLLSAVAVAACSGSKESGALLPPPIQSAKEVLDERAGLALADEGYGDGATKLVYLDQGWGPPETLWFYFADQGSVLMPYDVLVHLEQPGNEEPLMSPEHAAKFRFLPQRKTPNNPDALPVGFSRHDDKVGLTCAACHTNQIDYHGTAMRVDGASSLVDVVAWFAEVDSALEATLKDEKKLARFAAKSGAGNADAAKKSLQDSHTWFQGYLAANHSNSRPGNARMDAIGMIFNQVIRFTSGEKNSLEPNAPASTPFLWDAPRHDYVQWAAFSPNAGAGSVGRNAGEVIGVFGHVDVKHYTSADERKKGYPSTIQGLELVQMEETLRKLESPLWPDDVLPPIDRALASRGETLYKAQCASCHAVMNRADPDRKVTAMATGVDVVGTDAQAVQNLTSRRAPTGILQGAVNPKGGTYGADEAVAALLFDLVSGVLSAQPPAAVAAMANAKRHGIEETQKQGNHPQNTKENPVADLMSYKARPLNGIWATAPYLHNGSVPSLYDLLLPPAQRPKTFAVGRRELDPKKVGFVSDGQVPFVLDTSVTGNGNKGHEYGTTLSDGDRWALVEYLKSL